MYFSTWHTTVFVYSAFLSNMLEYARSRVTFFFIVPAPAEIYTLSLHDALPISGRSTIPSCRAGSTPSTTRSTPARNSSWSRRPRSEEHTSELQSRFDLVCRLLL